MGRTTGALTKALGRAAVVSAVAAGLMTGGMPSAHAGDTTAPQVQMGGGISFVVYSTSTTTIPFWLDAADASPIASATITFTSPLGEVEQYEMTRCCTRDDTGDEVWHADSRPYSRTDNKRFGRWTVGYAVTDSAGNTARNANARSIWLKGRTAVTMSLSAPSGTSTRISGVMHRLGPTGYVRYANRYVRVLFHPVGDYTRVQKARVLTASDGTYTATVPEARDGRWQVVFDGTTYFANASTQRWYLDR